MALELPKELPRRQPENTNSGPSLTLLVQNQALAFRVSQLDRVELVGSCRSLEQIQGAVLEALVPADLLRSN